MKPLIAFIARPGFEQLDAWLRVLQAALPQAQIVDFREIDEQARDGVSVAIVANPDPADIRLFANLQWVHSVWAGVERLVSDLADRELPIARLVDPRLADTMAEAVLAWTLYLHRDMPAYARQQRSAVWRQLPYQRPESRCVGVLGLGALGEAAASRLTGAGFQVCGWSRSPKSMAGVECFSGSQLEPMLAKIDILVCLVPLTPETTGLLDAQRFAAMKPGVQIINFARGAVIDDEALQAALDAGRVEHAVLDVFTVEPLPDGAWQWAHPRVTVLPHISAPTDMESAAGIVGHNIGVWMQSGRLPVTVDRSRGY